jgi:Helix-turn-helix domain
VARFAYNWTLAKWQQKYEADGKPSEVALRWKLNAMKHE